MLGVSYPHHGQESVQQVHSQDEGLCAVTEEAGETPQVLHFGISALGWDPTVILEETMTLTLFTLFSCSYGEEQEWLMFVLTCDVDSMRLRPASLGR